MGASLKMQYDWASPTWMSQRAWFPNLIYTTNAYTEIIGPFRMDYIYPINTATPEMIKNFKSPASFGQPQQLTGFAFAYPTPQPGPPQPTRKTYVSGFIYDASSIQYDQDGNALSPFGYLAWGRIAADMQNINQFIGHLTVTTGWYNDDTGQTRYVNTVLTAKSLNNTENAPPFSENGDFITDATTQETGFFYNLTVT